MNKLSVCRYRRVLNLLIASEPGTWDICEWKADAKSRTFAENAKSLDRTPVCLGNPLCDRKAQARAGGSACSRLICTIKAFEDVRQILLGNANSGVLNFYNERVILSERAHTDATV